MESTQTRRRTIAVRLLGQIEIVVDGEPFRLATPRKTLQLLTYLLLNRTAPISREYLAFLLYPDDEEVSTRSKLRGTIRDLLAVLPQPADDFVHSTTETIAWNAEAELWLDVDAFESASRDRERMREAVDLYRGDLLPELYDEWLYAIRERHHNAYLRCLASLASEARGRGEFSLAIETARKILAIDPWREDIVRRIMAIRNEAGDRAGALNEYARFAERLRAEMGVEPMPETVAVAERIAGGRAAASDIEGERTQTSAPATTRDAPLVGREAELERLVQAWSRTKQSRGGIVFLGGEPGIGKSRLALEFMRAVEDDGGRVLAGATGFPESFPYQALVEALRSGLPLIAALPLSKTRFAALAPLIPELSGRIGPLPDLPALDAEGQSLRLFDALTRTLVELSKPRPLLLVLEDLHWASESTFEAFAFIARQSIANRVLIVGTFRDDEAHRRHPLRRMQRETELQGVAATISLAPLDVAGVTAIVERASQTEVAPDFASAMHARSGGNPLFLAQLLAAPVHALSGTLPPTIASLVGARIAALPERARVFAEIAAFAGERFSIDVVRDVAGWSDAAALGALDELLDRRIVRETTGRGIFRYAFAHQLVQQSVLDAAADTSLRERSRRMARVLLELYPERSHELASDIARHLENGGEAEEAARHYLVAATRALELGATVESMQHANRGLAATTDVDVRVGLLQVRQRVHYRIGNAAAEAIDLDALASIATDSGNEDLLRTTLLAHVRSAVQRGVPNARAIVARLRDRAERTGDPRWEADTAYAELLQVQLDLSSADAVRIGRTAAEMYAGLGDSLGRAKAMSALAYSLSLAGRLEEARETIAEAVRLSSACGEYDTSVMSLKISCGIAGDARDTDEQASACERWLELARAAGDRREEAAALSQSSWPLAESPRFTLALKPLERALQIARECNLVRGEPLIASNAGKIYLRIGDFTKARTSLEASHAFYSRSSPGIASIPGHYLTLVFAHCGDPERAASLGRDALAHAESAGQVATVMDCLEALAEAEWRCGRRDSAIELYASALEKRRSAPISRCIAKDSAFSAVLHCEAGNVAKARAALALVPDETPTYLTDGLWPQRTAWAAAFAAHALGDDAQATRWLNRAHELYRAPLEYLDAEQRLAFDAQPWNRALLAAHEGRWPEAFW